MWPQIVPAERCLTCEVCCRFNAAGSLMAPVFSAEEMSAAGLAGLPGEAFCRTGYGRSEPILLRAGKGHAFCPAFDETANRCRIYPVRPLDCALYPFLLTYDEGGKSVRLAADMACPYVVDNLSRAELKEYAQRLAGQIDASQDERLVRDGGPVGFHRPEFEVLAQLPNLTRRLCRSDLGLARLTPGAVPALQHFFADDRTGLSHRAVAPIFAWVDLFNLYYRVVGERLLLFGEDGGAAFLWVPPVGKGALAPAVDTALEVLRHLGRRPDTWRIDNVAEDELATLIAFGLRPAETTQEFVYDRERLVVLSGRAYHGMKAACNFFVKHHDAVTFRPFEDGDIPAALALYRRWAAERMERYPDAFYRAQVEAAKLMHYRTMRHAGQFGLVGRSLLADGTLVGYTLGFPLPGGQCAVILVEVADLGVKGAGATIFREFARDWAPARWINTMGDSGLPSLRRAKMAYRPARLLPVHTLRPVRTDH